MPHFLRLSRSALTVALVALGLGAAALACEAHTEEVCHGGDCSGDLDPSNNSGGGGSGGSVSTGGSGTGGSGGAPACLTPQAGDFPCDVYTILQAQCHQCHNPNHDGTAPIDFMTCDRFSECACDSEIPRSQRAHDYVSSDFMPLGMMDLTPDQKQTLLDWFASGAPCVAAGEGCTGDPVAKGCGP